MKTTAYFDNVTPVKHPEVQREWVERVLANPVTTEVQPDGRVRFWAIIPEFDGKALRVITLEDRETVHNAFFDSGFLEKYQREK